MKKLLLSALCALAFLSLGAQTPWDEIRADSTRAAGLLMPYPGPQKAQTQAPRGYKPFYISHFGRHGSRWYTSFRPYEESWAVLSAADSAEALTPYGKDVLQRVALLREDARDRAGELTQKGFRQHKEIARRMFTNYRRVFRGRKHINANATQSGRVMLSMESFCLELLSLNPRLDISLDASARDREFLAHETHEVAVYGDEGAWREERDRLRDSLCHPDRLMGLLFADSAYLAAKVNAPKLMMNLYSLASIALDSDIDVRLGDLFTTTEWYELWQPGNYGYYMQKGPNPSEGEKFIQRSSLQTLEHIVAKADEAIATGDCAADLRFSHDSHLVPLSTTLQLDGCRAKATDPGQVAASWANYRISPMAGNIQLIFFRNRKGNVLVKFLLNENEVGIPAATDLYPYYRWEDVKAYYKEYYNL
ncbi:MAG: histidine-type phosphatase [Bacteroidales bacterium]|nr:histidine-type phosphatase [Bacteroidales bacterium]